MAGWRKEGQFAAAVKELHAQIRFKVGDGRADRGLGFSDAACRRSESTGLCGEDKNLQLFK